MRTQLYQGGPSEPPEPACPNSWPGSVPPAQAPAPTRSVELPPLLQLPASEAEYTELRARMRGPTKQCNWLIPGKVLHGAHPADAEALEALILGGVTTFVQLTSQQEAKQRGLFAYGKPAHAAFSHNRRKDPQMYMGRPCLEEALRSRQYKLATLQIPIPEQDECTPALDTKVLDIVEEIWGMLRNEEVVYLHCHDGHGSSALVCGALLAVLYLLDSFEVLTRLQVYHDSRAITKDMRCPATLHQVEQLHRVASQALRTNLHK